MDCKLYYFIPLRNGFAPTGLNNKYIAPARVLKYTFAPKMIAIVLYEGGPFVAFSKKKPKHIKVGGNISTGWAFDNNVLTLELPFAKDEHPEIELFF
jgi:hypothetical protein